MNYELSFGKKFYELLAKSSIQFEIPYGVHQIPIRRVKDQKLASHFLKCDNFAGFPFGPHLGLDSMMHTMGPAAVSTATATNGTANANPDPSINVSLENEDLWKRFHEIGTEMIITKMGR